MESDTGQVFPIILNCIAFEISLLITSPVHGMRREIQMLDSKKCWFKGNFLKSA